jgi:hypothetical protein
MKRSSRLRLLIAVAVGALLALAVAVPVVAGALGTEAQSGYNRMYSCTVTGTSDDGPWQTSGPSTVRMTYDLNVDPWTMKYLLVGTRLEPSEEYVLVNVFGIHDRKAGAMTSLWNYHLDLAWVDGNPPTASIIGRGRSNKAGLLTMKGLLANGELPGAYPALLAFPQAPYIGNSRNLMGADVWLLPAECIWSDTIHIPLYYWPAPEPRFVYSAAGLPFEHFAANTQAPM